MGQQLTSGRYVNNITNDCHHHRRRRRWRRASEEGYKTLMISLRPIEMISTIAF